jgi:hypothetical protein
MQNRAGPTGTGGFSHHRWAIRIPALIFPTGPPRKHRPVVQRNIWMHWSAENKLAGPRFEQMGFAAERLAAGNAFGHTTYVQKKNKKKLSAFVHSDGAASGRVDAPRLPRSP